MIDQCFRWFEVNYAVMLLWYGIFSTCNRYMIESINTIKFKIRSKINSNEIDVSLFSYWITANWKLNGINGRTLFHEAKIEREGRGK